MKGALLFDSEAPEENKPESNPTEMAGPTRSAETARALIRKTKRATPRRPPSSAAENAGSSPTAALSLQMAHISREQPASIPCTPTECRMEHPEEVANALTHGAGVVLSVGGLVSLIIVAALHGGTMKIVSCCVYGVTLVCLYAASTLYHAIVSPRWKRIFKIIDHCCIYLLIAGTYTPFALVSLHGPWGWTLFGIVWGLAVIGILFKLWFVDHMPIASTVVYIAMGWLIVIAIKPLVTVVSMSEFAWLLMGGLLYTAGVIFFGWKNLRYGHAIWHVFVLAGSICHYVAVLTYVAQLRA